MTQQIVVHNQSIQDIESMAKAAVKSGLFGVKNQYQRAPLSATALASIVKEAEKAAMHIEEALTECVTRGWQSFKAEWMKPKTTTKPERFSNF